MIAEFQFGTEVLDPALSDAPAEAVGVPSLEATPEVPLCAGHWVAEPATLDGDLAERDQVRGVTEVAAGERGRLYRVRYDDGFHGATVYQTAVEHAGLFLSGRADEDGWTLRLRFPDRDATAACREACAAAGAEVTVDGLYDPETTPAGAYVGLTDPQRRALTVAARTGYFEVPRRTSLSGLADELDVSSQAASERIRRGLDTLVDETLLSPADGSFTR